MKAKLELNMRLGYQSMPRTEEDMHFRRLAV